MSNLRYYNQSAPFWDFIADLEAKQTVNDEVLAQAYAQAANHANDATAISDNDAPDPDHEHDNLDEYAAFGMPYGYTGFRTSLNPFNYGLPIDMTAIGDRRRGFGGRGGRCGPGGRGKGHGRGGMMHCFPGIPGHHGPHDPSTHHGHPGPHGPPGPPGPPSPPGPPGPPGPHHGSAHHHGGPAHKGPHHGHKNGPRGPHQNDEEEHAGPSDHNEESRRGGPHGGYPRDSRHHAPPHHGSRHCGSRRGHGGSCGTGIGGDDANPFNLNTLVEFFQQQLFGGNAKITTDLANVFSGLAHAANGNVATNDDTHPGADSKDVNRSSDFVPSVDVFDTEAAFIVHASLPGAKKSDIAVTWDAERSELSISGVVHRPGDEELISTLALDERQKEVGVFERKVRLGSYANPAVVEVDGIVAKLEDGILRVTVPKEDKEYVEIKMVDIE